MTPDDRLHVVRQVRDRLDELAGALIRVDLQALLSSEADLEAATTALRRVDARSLPPGADTREALDGAYRALMRCRRLGASLSDVLRIADAAQGAARMAETYNPQGHSAVTAASGHALQTQV